MSAFDLCTKTTADSSWKYDNVIFMNITTDTVKHTVIDAEIGSSICSNSFVNHIDLDNSILSNLSKCKLS